MSDHRKSDQFEAGGQQPPRREGSASADPLELIEECLAAFPDSDPRQKLLYKLRHVITAQSVVQDRRETEFKKLNEVVAKLTAPANRVGLLLEVPAEGLARIVVVESRAVRQDQITFHLMKRKGAMRIDLGEVILFLVLLQPRHAEPARILMRVLASIVPPTFEIAGQMGPYQLHRFFDRIDHLEIFSRDPVFRFYTEQMHSCFIHCRAKDLFPDSRFL